MPTAVIHILVPLVIIALIRDYYLSKKEKRKFPLHYVLIAGIAGALPDIDFLFFFILNFFEFTIEQIHRTFTHSLFFPLIFLIFYFTTKNVKWSGLGRHKLTLSMVSLMIAFGSFIHIILDAIIVASIFPFYPFSQVTIGLDLVNYLPEPFNGIIIPIIEGALLIFWLVYLEWKHKISDFI